MTAHLILLAALSATPDAELQAQGFALESVSPEGVRTWSKPLTTMRCGSGCSSGGCSTQGACGMSGCGTQMGCGSTQMGCSSGSCGSSQQRGRIGGNPVPRLVPIEKDEPLVDIKPAPTAPKAEPVDTDKIAAAIVEKMANDPRFKGPKGDKGDPGADGAPGKDAPPVDEEKIAALVLAKIDYAKIAGMVNVKPAPPVVNSEKHIVVVADKNAGYWARIGGEVATAQQSYLGIEVADKPPFDVGPMPQIIQYENGIPKVLGKGTYEVSSVLSQLARGEFE